MLRANSTVVFGRRRRARRGERGVRRGGRRRAIHLARSARHRRDMPRRVHRRARMTPVSGNIRAFGAVEVRASTVESTVARNRSTPAFPSLELAATPAFPSLELVTTRALPRLTSPRLELKITRARHGPSFFSLELAKTRANSRKLSALFIIGLRFLDFSNTRLVVVVVAKR